jgi:thymidylate kinase
MHPYKGISVISEGIDGTGKGKVVEAWKEWCKANGLLYFDLLDFWQKERYHPQFTQPDKKYFLDISKYDVIFSAEPTHAWHGAVIREEYLGDNGRMYDTKTIATAYAEDRRVLFNREIGPALEMGKLVLQSRNDMSSYTYQIVDAQQKGQKWTLEDALLLEGNILALQSSPNLIIISTVKDVEEVIKRIKERPDQQDKHEKNYEMQRLLKPMYESKELTYLYESRGTQIRYLDAGISVESTKAQAKDILGEFLKSKGFLK